MKIATPLTRSSAPLLLPGLALWGWQTELWPWALAMGVLLELPRIVSARLEISATDFNRLWNFTTLLFLGVGLYVFLARAGLDTVGSIVSSDTPGGRVVGLREISQTILQFLRWLPFVFYPFVLAHAWSRSTTLSWSTFSLYAQTRAQRSPTNEETSITKTPQVHPGYLYITLVLFASTGTASHPFLYQTLLLGVLLVALWPWRNPRFGWWSRVVLCVALLAVTLLVQLGMNRLRDALQSWENRLVQSSAPAGFDQLRSVTAIGAIGRLKQSGRIVLRVRTSDARAPGLLREGVFNRYRGQAWNSTYRDFAPAGSPAEGTVWRIAPGRRFERSLTIARATAQGEAQLALPGEVLSVRDLPAVNIETNYLAAARLQDGPPIARYVAEAGQGGGFDGPPGREDTNLDSLGEADRAAIHNVAQQLGLAAQSAAAAIQTVERFFASGFEYSLWQRRPVTNASPLAVFLQETRAGHCEYFATATTLLLREAGVPARYAVGYSPQSRRGEEWLARGRDAHAWCLAFVSGRWLEVDTTPGIWREREAERAGWWEGVMDFFSHAWYRWTVWRQEGGNWQLAVFILGMVVLSWLAWRQLRGSRWRRTLATPTASSADSPIPGLDSELYPVLDQLEKRVGARRREETLLAWIRRTGLASAALEDHLEEAVSLHYRLRFDPQGLPKIERDRLRELAHTLQRSAEESRPTASEQLETSPGPELGGS